MDRFDGYLKTHAAPHAFLNQIGFTENDAIYLFVLDVNKQITAAMIDRDANWLLCFSVAGEKEWRTIVDNFWDATHSRTAASTECIYKTELVVFGLTSSMFAVFTHALLAAIGSHRAWHTQPLPNAHRWNPFAWDGTRRSMQNCLAWIFQLHLVYRMCQFCGGRLSSARLSPGAYLFQTQRHSAVLFSMGQFHRNSKRLSSFF